MKFGNPVTLLEATKFIDCKLIFKTKRHPKGDVKRYKAPFQFQGKTLRNIMALVAHSDFELNQMDIKTAFLNGDIDEMVYIIKPKSLVSRDPKKMVCKLKKSIWTYTGCPSMVT